jgi:hypothetical protein
MPTYKRGTSYRLSDEALAVISALAERWGISQASVIELCVREVSRWVERAGPKVEPPSSGKPGRKRK